MFLLIVYVSLQIQKFKFQIIIIQEVPGLPVFIRLRRLAPASAPVILILIVLVIFVFIVRISGAAGLFFYRRLPGRSPSGGVVVVFVVLLFVFVVLLVILLFIPL